MLNGLITYYEYNKEDNLIKEGDNFGKEYKYECDSKGNVIKNIVKIDDERELVVLYEYDDELAIIRLNLINLELSRGLIKSYFFIF